MPDVEALLRGLIPALLAAGAALWVDRATEARGFLPPGHREPWRRIGALLVLASIFYLGVFLPVGRIGLAPEPLPEDLSTPGLFLVQGLLVLSLVAWYVLGYVGAPSAGRSPADLAEGFARQFGLRAERTWDEIGIGLAAGLLGWMVVIALMIATAMTIYLLGGEELLPKAPPEVVPVIAGLPFVVRVAIGVTAGVVEESFFRGFLQPRVGIPLSTGLFVLAHLSYEQPFMLLGITALSLLFAFLVVWRRNVLAAIVAHAVFDLVQLLLIVPWVLRHLPDMAPALLW
ncbi:MAG: type II CAAX endopeptidase family protein [Acidobacteriota bacterium]